MLFCLGLRSLDFNSMLTRLIENYWSAAVAVVETIRVMSVSIGLQGSACYRLPSGADRGGVTNGLAGFVRRAQSWIQSGLICFCG